MESRRFRGHAIGWRRWAAGISVAAAVALLMSACVVPGGISVTFVNNSGSAYTDFTFGGTSVNGGTINAQSSYTQNAVVPNTYDIQGKFDGAAINLNVTVNTTDTADTWTGPTSAGQSGSWSN